MLIYILPFLLLPALFLLGASGPQSLCGDGERILFNCPAKNGKIISLCASPVLEGESGHLQYRFGTEDKIEMRFPDELKGSAAKFYQGHYFRYQFDLRRVGFEKAGTSYEIFWGYDGEDGTPSDHSGVTVKKGEEETEIACTAPPVMKFEELENILPCQEDAYDCPHG